MKKNISLVGLILILLPIYVQAADFIIHTNNVRLNYLLDNKSTIFFGFNKARINCTGQGSPELKQADIFAQVDKSDCFLCDYYIKSKKVLNSLKYTQNEIEGERLFLRKINIRDINASELKDVRKLIISSKKNILRLKNDAKKFNTRQKYFHQKLVTNSQTDKPYILQKNNCDKTITANFRGLHFNFINSVSVPSSKSGKYEGKVTRYIRFVNKSGVDIKGDGYIVFGPYSPRMQIPHFTPQIIEKVPRRKVKAHFDSVNLASRQRAFSAEASAPTRVNKGDGNIYHVTNLDVKSNGKEQQYKIRDNSVLITLRNVVYPYRTTKVYKEIRYRKQFDNKIATYNIKLDNEIYKNVDVRYDNGDTVLFAGRNRNVIVHKNNNIKFNEEQGIFDREKVKKDGFKLNISNISNKKIFLNIHERIPTSSDEQIQVQDLHVTNKNGTDLLDKNCKITEKGELICHIALPKHSNKEIKVAYQIVYDEEIENIYY